MFSSDGSKAPLKLRRSGKAYLYGDTPVAIVYNASPDKMKSLEDAGFHPIDVESLRADVMKGNQARNVLKSIGLDVPTNKEYFRRDRDEPLDGEAVLES